MKSISPTAIADSTTVIGAAQRHVDPASTGMPLPHRWRLHRAFLAAAAVLCCAAVPPPPLHAALVPRPAFGLQIPQGFNVSLFATENLADNITSLTIDSKGRVVVSGPGYIRTLLDRNNDGMADDAVLFADVKSGAMGMCFDGNTLYFVSEGGLYRLQDADLDGRGEGDAQLISTLNFGEHGAHAIRRGPDGGWWWMTGNDAGVHSGMITDPSSPIRAPQAGTLVRFAPGFTQLAVHSHGFRNAYDFDFNQFGDLFTYDSDVERDFLLPWYTPTRLFHVGYGGHHGWRLTGFLRSFARPIHDPMVVPPIQSMGRGSPTGVVCYRHFQFPSRYSNALFLLDWTFGRIWTSSLVPAGGTYESSIDLFAEALPNSGFAPTDAAVAMDGSLLVSVGGRNTRGAVYKFTYVAEKSRTTLANGWMDPNLPDPAAVMIAPQPLDAWSRAIWVPLAQRFGAQTFDTAAANETLPDSMRIRSIEILTDVHGGMTTAGAKSAARAQSPFVRASVAWSLGAVPCADFVSILSPLTADASPLVRRVALESMLEHVEKVQPSIALQAAQLNIAHSDRRIRSLATQLAVFLPLEQWKILYPSQIRGSAQAQISAIAAAQLRFPSNGIAPNIVDQLLLTLGKCSRPEEHLQVLDLLVEALGGWQIQQPVAEFLTAYDTVYAAATVPGLVPRLSKAISPLLLNADPTVAQEAARVLAMISDPTSDLPARILDTVRDKRQPEDYFHALACLAKLPTRRSPAATDRTVSTLLRLTSAVAGLENRPKQNWNDRFRELMKQLVKSDTNLVTALLKAPTFATPPNLPIALALEESDRIKAARILLSWPKSNPSADWPPGLVELLSLLPPSESRPLIRGQLAKLGQRDAVTIALAREPEITDRTAFLEGLDSPNPAVVQASLQALLTLPRDTQLRSVQSALALLDKSLRQVKSDPTPYQVATLVGYLANEEFQLIDGGGSLEERRRQFQKVFNRCAQKYPTLASALNQKAVEIVDIEKLLASVVWDKGNSARGVELFQARQCAACHLNDRAVGPDLAGITRRLPPAEVFRHVWDPHRDIAESYRAIEVLTRDGRTWTGIPFFVSADGLMIKDATGQVTRLATENIMSQRTLGRSLMPDGLLQGMSASDLADLYAYLRQL